jgi:hypothetical protein
MWVYLNIVYYKEFAYALEAKFKQVSFFYFVLYLQISNRSNT